MGPAVDTAPAEESGILGRPGVVSGILGRPGEESGILERPGDLLPACKF